MLDRIEERVKKTESGCWIWQGCLSHGYGMIKIPAETPSGATTVGVHVLAWREKNGPVPAGLELDHVCRTRACCNPEHLEPVTRRENLLRSPLSAASRLSARTHCPRGHELSGTNLVRSEPTRTCRICAQARKNAYLKARAARLEQLCFEMDPAD